MGERRLHVAQCEADWYALVDSIASTSAVVCKTPSQYRMQRHGGASECGCGGE